MSGEAGVERINGVAVARSIPLRGLQRTVAQRLLAGARETAAVTAMAEVDAGRLLASVRRLRETIPALSLTHLLIQAVARCLRRHPRLNATLLDETIHELAEVNIAVALALPSDDLAVGVIRAADEKPLVRIASDLAGVQERAAAGRSRLEDVRGGTFTLSNYGALRHVVWATPIITPGQVAVLGVGRATPRVVPDDSPAGWSTRPVLPLSLTYDHRVVNGLPVGRFLDDLADHLETDDWTEATE